MVERSWGVIRVVNFLNQLFQIDRSVTVKKKERYQLTTKGEASRSFCLKCYAFVADLNHRNVIYSGERGGLPA